MGLRITTWNVAWFGQLLKGHTRTLPRNSKAVRGATEKALQALQRAKIAEQIIRLDPDVLCLQEGPSTGNVNRLESFCNQDLEGRWSVIKRPAGEPWHIRGSQGIFFLVRSTKLAIWQPRLLAQSAWFEATEIESRVDINHVGSGEHNKKWPVIHPLFKPDGQPALEEPLVGDESEGDGVVDLGEREHSHYRHPQVLVLTIGDKRVDIVGCHLKSKFGGDDYRAAGIARFRNEPDPVVFVCGDFNDGVGREVFERQYLFHDAISNMQGDVFFASRFLNHALFDYSQGNGEDHRWSARFVDVWDPVRKPEILLDHIVFTQSVVGSEHWR